MGKMRKSERDSNCFINNQKEILELKKAITELKKSLEEFGNSLEQTEERISEL